MLHLLITFPFTMKLWDNVLERFCKSDMNKATIEETLKNWTLNPYTYPILNHILQMAPKFILWNTWKKKKIEYSKENPTHLR